MVVGSSKYALTIPFSTVLWVAVAYLQLYFEVQVSYKVAFKERTSNIIVKENVCFLSILSFISKGSLA